MQRAKAFFFVCAGVFLLALSYHLGSTSAGAQAPGNSAVGISGEQAVIVTANGDVYEPFGTNSWAQGWHRTSNIFTGPTSAQNETWGQLKARYR